MNFIPNRFNIIPQPSPSSQDYLSQSIVKSFNSIKTPQPNIKKQNNNSLPDIQTDLLKSLNPEIANLHPQFSFQKVQTHRANNFVSPRFQSDSRMKVSFSYGSKVQNVLHVNQSAPQGINLITRPNNFLMFRPNSSVQNPRNFSNLSQLSRSKQSHNLVMTSQPLQQFQRPLTELPKTHKLGRKFKNYQFMKNENIQKQQSNFPVYKQTSQNTSFEVIQSPRKNISSISIQKSQYVFMTQNKDEQMILLQPQVYAFSHRNMAPKNKNMAPKNNKNIFFNMQNTSMILPIQQEENSFIQMPVINQVSNKNKLQKSQSSQKSPSKIDNLVYLQDQKPSSMTFLDNLQNKGSRLSQIADFSKMSRISKINSRKELDPSFKNDKMVSPFRKLQEDEINSNSNRNSNNNNNKNNNNNENNKNNKNRNKDVDGKQDSQRSQLKKRVSQLQQLLKQKQQQNVNLKSKLQNAALQQQIQSQYENLQVIAKLNQVQIKKLQNEIKMFKIKQKIFQNKQKEQCDLINGLKTQIKILKGSVSVGYLLPYTKNKSTVGLGF